DSVCGDGVCDDQETCTGCAADCGACAAGPSFQASTGVLTAPFYLSGGAVQQNATASGVDATSGSATYTFTIPTAGEYTLDASVNAPNTGQNSFFVNIDAQPQAPLMIWDIPVTSGFQTRTLAWRGNGTGDPAAAQYIPKTFT